MTDLKNAKNNETEEEISGTSEVYRKFSKKRPGTEYELYLPPGIEGDPVKYIDLIHDLRSFTEDDEVKLYLDNDGGACDVGLRIARAIQDCKATTHIILEANSYSMGAIIALSGDMLTMRPGTYLMFHNYTAGTYGKGGETRLLGEERDRSFWKQAIDIICPFLTLKEIQQLKDDRDIYIVAPSKRALTKKDRDDNSKLLAELKKRYIRHFPLAAKMLGD